MPLILVTDTNPGTARWDDCEDVLDGCLAPPVISQRTTWKLPVRVTSETNVSLSPPPATVDSVPLVDEDRIGLVGQTDSTENGIYKRTSLTVWERDSDFTNEAVAEAGVEFYTQEGTLNAGKTYLLTTQGDIDVGTTPLTFVDNSGGGGPDVVEIVEIAHTVAFTTTSPTFVPVPGFAVTFPSDGDWLVLFESEVAWLTVVAGDAGAEVRLVGCDLDGTIPPTRQVILRDQPNIKSWSVFGRAVGRSAGQSVQVHFRRGAAVAGTVYLLRGRLVAVRTA